MFLIILVNLLYALVCPLGKIALNYTTPLFLTAFRMILSGSILLFYQYIYRSDKFIIKRKHILYLLIGSVFSIYLTNVLEFLGLDYLSPAKTAFLYNLYPFSSALVSYIYLNERMSKIKWLGLAIGFLGSLPLLLSDTSQEVTLYKFFGFISLPELAVIGAVFACPFGWIFVQKLIWEDKYDSVMANGVTMFAGGLMALVHSMLVESWNPLPITNTVDFLKTSLTLMLVSNIISNSLFVELLKTYSLTFLSFTGFVTPLLTAIFDKFFFGYAISYSFYISTAIMLIGFYLFYKDELKGRTP